MMPWIRFPLPRSLLPSRVFRLPRSRSRVPGFHAPSFTGLLYDMLSLFLLPFSKLTLKGCLGIFIFGVCTLFAYHLLNT